MVTATASVAVVDVLNSLIEVEKNSIFRAMGEDSPYVREAPADVRRVLQEEHEATFRNARDLARLVRQMGGQPIQDNSPAHAPPMLEFISLKFLLPKLIEEKELMVRFYDNAIRAVRDVSPEAAEVLRRHDGLHRQHLEAFREALRKH